MCKPVWAGNILYFLCMICYRYVNLKACITRLPDTGYGVNVTSWPARLQNPPDRLQSIQIDAYISRKELFKAESKYWNEIIESYVRALHWKNFKLRNVLDMKAGFGGYDTYIHLLYIVNSKYTQHHLEYTPKLFL